jgi:hypothetical protein
MDDIFDVGFMLRLIVEQESSAVECNVHYQASCSIIVVAMHKLHLLHNFDTGTVEH